MYSNSISYKKDLLILLKSNSDPVNAVFMKKYMRNKFEFFGIGSPARKELFRSFVREHGWPEVADLDGVCRDLYNERERELHYFAMEMVDRNIKRFDTGAVKLFEFMIVSASWWDTVDFIAANIVGKFFRIHPEMIGEVTTEWMNSGNIWLQRTCLLLQLKYKKETNSVLLFGFIEKLLGSDEFFIQKSIGWALREYSKTNPDAVFRFTERTNLKPLSRREALRIILKNKV